MSQTRRLNPEEQAEIDAAARVFFAAVLAVQMRLDLAVAPELSADQKAVASKGTALNLCVQASFRIANESSGNTLEMLAHTGGAMAALLRNLEATNGPGSFESAATAFNIGFERIDAAIQAGPPSGVTVQ